MKIVTKLFLVHLAVAQIAFAEPDSDQRNRLMQYLTDIGVTETVELQITALRKDYEDIYTQVPPCFWEDDRVHALFNSYKTATLESYIVVMEKEFSAEEIDFLIEFYQSRDGRRAVQLGKRMTPAFVAAGSEINLDFSEALIRLITEIAEESQGSASGETQHST